MAETSPDADVLRKSEEAAATSMSKVEDISDGTQPEPGETSSNMEMREHKARSLERPSQVDLHRHSQRHHSYVSSTHSEVSDANAVMSDSGNDDSHDSGSEKGLRLMVKKLQKEVSKLQMEVKKLKPQQQRPRNSTQYPRPMNRIPNRPISSRFAYENDSSRILSPTPPPMFVQEGRMYTQSDLRSLDMPQEPEESSSRYLPTPRRPPTRPRRASTVSNDSSEADEDRPNTRLWPSSAIIPRLNFVDSKGFQAECVRRFNRDEGRGFAIDVLLGDPPKIDSETFRYQVILKSDEQPTQLEAPVNVNTLHFTGALQLPERIRINSWEIIEALRDILVRRHPIKQRPAAMPRIIIRPFKILTFLEDEIRKLHDRLAEDTVIRSHLGCLLEFIDTIVNKRAGFVRDGGSGTRVTYGDLWFLMRPGDEVTANNSSQAYRVISTEGCDHDEPENPAYEPIKTYRSRDRSGFKITCAYIDSDGAHLGSVFTTFVIPHFGGEKAVLSLPVYPLAHFEQPGLRGHLIARGKRFMQMTGISHWHYSGLTLEPVEDVDSQVVVDAQEAFSSNPKWKPNLQTLVAPEVVRETGFGNITPCSSGCCGLEPVFPEREIATFINRQYIESILPKSRSQRASLVASPRPIKEIEEDGTDLSADEYAIMSDSVFGFILRSRKWAELDISHISQSGLKSDHLLGKAGEQAFDQLVLPPGHKEMVKSLITQHFRHRAQNAANTDIIRGKGKGLIILLHGAPGVGKTTTAECVAEYFNKPLFQITCGDLGVFVSEVESALEKHFALASRWGCILLLDEADVFLAARTPTDHMRNGLVSVFLRILEYYAGILFLTTNRVGDFDEAFASRIHMSLHYPPLDLKSTQRIFNLNLGRHERRLEQQKTKLIMDMVGIGGFIANYWNDFPKARWNGRQIRNACQTALALAEYEAQDATSEQKDEPPDFITLNCTHFETVAKSYLDFSEYLKDIYGVHADERAKENFIRAAVRDQGAPAKPLNPLMTPRRQHLSSWDNRRQDYPSQSYRENQGGRQFPHTSHWYSNTQAGAMGNDDRVTPGHYQDRPASYGRDRFQAGNPGYTSGYSQQQREPPRGPSPHDTGASTPTYPNENPEFRQHPSQGLRSPYQEDTRPQHQAHYTGAQSPMDPRQVGFESQGPQSPANPRISIGHPDDDLRPGRPSGSFNWPTGSMSERDGLPPLAGSAVSQGLYNQAVGAPPNDHNPIGPPRSGGL
ncbi:hypothetical protein QBC43DRAFT_325295 [Cladorrhinum sp. PSN259]|nr:hypothetical protein QBC43DRAFT_325295 [Cladorrhinum sp. PSN259]